MADFRLSRQQLFNIRNRIPITRVIEALAIGTEYDGELVRFCCPACNGFNTATNPQTNLARCFSCRKNYNTIDLVIAVNRLSFIDSVTYLNKLKNNSSVSERSFPQTAPVSDCSEEAIRHDNPVAIGDILRSIATPHLPTEDNLKVDTTLEKRIATLEEYVKILAGQIAQIERLQRDYR